MYYSVTYTATNHAAQSREDVVLSDLDLVSLREVLLFVAAINGETISHPTGTNSGPFVSEVTVRSMAGDLIDRVWWSHLSAYADNL